MKLVLSTKTIVLLGVGIVLVIVIICVILLVANIPLVPSVDVNSILGAKASAP